jgi:UDPglucose 6-dehydrogenase
VRTWDPIADASDLLPAARQCATIEEAVEGAHAAVIVTEWPELADLARPEIRDLMARPLIIDGRNLLDPEKARGMGFDYEGMGRPMVATLPRSDSDLAAIDSADPAAPPPSAPPPSAPPPSGK